MLAQTAAAYGIISPMEELRQRLANLAEHVAGIMVRL